MTITEIDAPELDSLITAGRPVLLIDVRYPNEYAYCHLAESILIPLPELSGRVSEINPDEGVKVVVYCHHGVRSLSGASILMAAGMENVVSLAGGIDAWSRLVDPSVPRY